ncbi:unnamed protein product [Meloidogyne enterolobii]|uniref:Uncharacterized protein n=1 Tax=Meloidogyne enterolobii TaxID=390850 RepID=A0ACB0Z5C8_MELEN
MGLITKTVISQFLASLTVELTEEVNDAQITHIFISSPIAGVLIIIFFLSPQC